MYAHIIIQYIYNTNAVTNWFTAITSKNYTVFIQFDITDYNTSITKYTLDRPLKLAAVHSPSKIIKHCRKLLLFHDNKPWIKIQLFDITMGSFDGAGVCKLVGVLILSQLSNIIRNNDIYIETTVLSSLGTQTDLNYIATGKGYRTL